MRSTTQLFLIVLCIIYLASYIVYVGFVNANAHWPHSIAVCGLESGVLYSERGSWTWFTHAFFPNFSLVAIILTGWYALERRASYKFYIPWLFFMFITFVFLILAIVFQGIEMGQANQSGVPFNQANDIKYPCVFYNDPNTTFGVCISSPCNLTPYPTEDDLGINSVAITRIVLTSLFLALALLSAIVISFADSPKRQRPKEDTSLINGRAFRPTLSKPLHGQ